MADNDAAAELKEFYATYIDAFNREDVAALAALISYPALFEGPGHPPHVISDPHLYRQLIEETLRRFKAKGWTRSAVDKLQAFATAADTGILIADFDRYRHDGSVLEHKRAHYVLRRRDGRWTMVAAIEGLSPPAAPS